MNVRSALPFRTEHVLHRIRENVTFVTEESLDDGNGTLKLLKSTLGLGYHRLSHVLEG
jgi:hypothetical protein